MIIADFRASNGSAPPLVLPAIRSVLIAAVRIGPQPRARPPNFIENHENLDNSGASVALPMMRRSVCGRRAMTGRNKTKTQR